jgi:hypothetical protein
VKIFIREQSFIARCAGYALNERRMAVTMGRTINLWNASKEDLMKNKTWLRHELVHVEQFRQKGFLRFLLLYAWESLKHGYQNNRFEVEARARENENMSFASFEFN